MAAVGMMIVVFMLMVGGLIYLLLSAFISKGLSKNKKIRLLYFALFLTLPFLVAILNYQGFCFKKMRFLNEQDIYESLNSSEYKRESNDCYGAYIFSSKTIYGNFETDIDGIHMYDNGLLSRILGLSYARIQGVKSNHPIIITNCGSITFSEL
ncbi:MAG: hypothetical protein IJ187_06280 [Neisseriaceae bacterium]|nr:hypothetical protein [Neisseriaceae bacterium]